MQSFSDARRIAHPAAKPDGKVELSLPARRKRAAGAGEGTNSPDFITALARGLEVLRCFRHGVTALGNLDLARLTGLPKPTISRITYTLTELGYLRYHPDTGKYSPGYGELMGQLFRLSHMGPGQVHPTILAAQLAIFERALADMGHPVQLGAGVGAAMAELAAWTDER